MTSSSAFASPTPFTAGAHYVSDSLYSLGSLACCVCGHQFPLTTSPHSHAVCGNCGVAHKPGSYLDLSRPSQQGNAGGANWIDSYFDANAQIAAARFFTPDEIAEAVAHVEAVCGGADGKRPGDSSEDADAEHGAGASPSSVVRVGQTAVDNRVLEEAFCENCATHRMCKTFARQTRSADEGQTIFFQCTVCNAEWQQSS